MDNLTPAQKCVAHARSLLNAKWRHRGRKPWAIDCIGLVVVSVAAGGIVMRDRLDYGREPWKDGLRQELVSHFGEPVSGEWLPGDVALIRFETHPEPGHVGIIADYTHGGLSLIHSYSRVSVTEHALDHYWRSLIIEVYRPWQW